MRLEKLKMKKIFCLLIVSLLVLSPQAARAGNAYLTAIPDIPLMSGMKKSERETQALVFDKDSGRIVEEIVSAAGISRQDVANFYASTLPQLGWKIKSEEDSMQRFVRNREQLIVKWEEIKTGVAAVRFSLSPAP